MADFVYNIAKGYISQYAANIIANSPTNSAFIVCVFDMGVTTDATLKDLDTLQAVIDDANSTERTTNGWSRVTVDDTGEGLTVTVDDTTNDCVDVDMNDITWTSVTSGTSTDLVIGYDSDTTAGTDSNIIPCTQHDFAVTPDGSNVTAQIATGGWYRAS